MAARFFLVVAFGGAAYLAVVSLSGGGVAGCGPGSGCDTILSSRWAYWLGAPVSLPALAIYGSLFAATFGIDPVRSLAARRRCAAAVVALSGLIVAAAIWFGVLQYAVIGHWCRLCLATHGSAILASILLLLSAGARNVLIPPSLLRHALGLPLLAFSALVIGQLAVKPSPYALTRFSGGGISPSSKLILDGGRFALDPDRLPMMGTPASPDFVVALFDYTCEHCRRMHSHLRAAAAHLSGQVAIIMLPVPLESDCNPLIKETQPANFGACAYARLSLAVWIAQPSAFREFDDYLIGGDDLPNYEQAQVKAEALVGRERLERGLRDPRVSRQIATDVRLYLANSRATGNARLPQLIFADAAVSGEVGDAKELEQLIGRHSLFSRHP